jgi:hypothetical protein
MRRNGQEGHPVFFPSLFWHAGLVEPFALDDDIAEYRRVLPAHKHLAADFWINVFQQEAQELAFCGEEAVQLCMDLLRQRLLGLFDTDSADRSEGTCRT